MNEDTKTANTRSKKQALRMPAWLVSALCVLGTGVALYLSGVLSTGAITAEAQGPLAKAAPEEVVLAYTVNNLGYTATCG